MSYRLLAKQAFNLLCYIKNASQFFASTANGKIEAHIPPEYLTLRMKGGGDKHHKAGLIVREPSGDIALPEGLTCY